MPAFETAEKPARKGVFGAFLDFFILFSGISTKSNLERTQRRPLIARGLFLFRGRRGVGTPGLVEQNPSR